MEYLIKLAKKQVDKKLKKYPERLKHVYGVAETAEKLAQLYDVDPSEAYIVGLYHDYAKYDRRSHKHLTKKEIKVVKKYPVMFHAYEAAYRIQENLAIDKPYMIHAIRSHVWGRPEMHVLEKIIFVSDMCEPNRAFPDAKDIYKLATKDLDQAVLKCMKISIKDVKNKNKKPSPMQLEAYRYYKEVQRGKKIKNNH